MPLQEEGLQALFADITLPSTYLLVQLHASSASGQHLLQAADEPVVLEDRLPLLLSQGDHQAFAELFSTLAPPLLVRHHNLHHELQGASYDAF